jgi:hypothetical protein
VVTDEEWRNLKIVSQAAKGSRGMKKKWSQDWIQIME